eukprot:TRINITY_DN1382_c0_g1_i1.p1 TRINITY_DN1382_c0_g1~~TRINITY_DN1382_c0_g1_i1.p1  ORF type:complete len:439 (-),score=72.51 TRINITY_DN1382_c0_g1_i1:174-1490(-)
MSSFGRGNFSSSTAGPSSRPLAMTTTTTTSTTTLPREVNFHGMEESMTDEQNRLDDLLAIAESRPRLLMERPEDIDEPDISEGQIWDKFVNSPRGITFYLGLTLYTVELLLRLIQPEIAEKKKKGGKPQLSWADHLVLYLTWLHNGFDYDKLAGWVGMKTATLGVAIERIRPILHSALTKRWTTNRQRPKIVPDHPNFSWIGLIMDSTSTEVFRPTGRFEEAKKYFDGKNHFYALKSEVAIMATKPYYCLFVQPAVVGSIHDYTYHEENFKSYISYLTKTPAEQLLFRADPNTSWAILGDKAYNGPPTDTPGLRRIAVPKNPPARSQTERDGHELAEIRVAVEQFFGRLEQKWAVFRHCYRWSHDHFDMDFATACWLTNECIQERELVQDDAVFHRTLLDARAIRQQERETKRIQARNTWYANKKRKNTLSQNSQNSQ